MTAHHHDPYQPGYYPPVPTKRTRYLRRSLPWQGYRFLVILGRIFRVMFKTGG